MNDQLHIFQTNKVARRIYVECLRRPLSKKEISNRTSLYWGGSSIIKNVKALKDAGYLECVEGYTNTEGISYKALSDSRKRPQWKYQATPKPFFDGVSIEFSAKERRLLELIFYTIIPSETTIIQADLSPQDIIKNVFEDAVITSWIKAGFSDGITKQHVRLYHNLERNKILSKIKKYLTADFISGRIEKRSREETASAMRYCDPRKYLKLIIDIKLLRKLCGLILPESQANAIYSVLERDHYCFLNALRMEKYAESNKLDSGIKHADGDDAKYENPPE